MKLRAHVQSRVNLQPEGPNGLSQAPHDEPMVKTKPGKPGLGAKDDAFGKHMDEGLKAIYVSRARHPKHHAIARKTKALLEAFGASQLASEFWHLWLLFHHELKFC